VASIEMFRHRNSEDLLIKEEMRLCEFASLEEREEEL